MKSIASSYIWGPTMLAVSKKMRVSANPSKRTYFEFFNNFLYKIEIQRGIFYGKNLHLVYIGPHAACHFG